MWIAEKIYYQGSSAFTRAYQGDELVWERPSGERYITFTAKQAQSTVGLNSISDFHTMMYSYDGFNWNSMTTGTTITLNNSGDSVYVRGVLSADQPYYKYTNFTTSGNLKLSGNINYLWNYQNVGAALKGYCGFRMFQDCTALTDVTELELPATTLASDCYMYMFYGCTSLTTAPVLPATTLAAHCYESMFKGCTSLTTAPVLPATTLATGCYREMFWNCTSLITAPVLPVTTLATSCYLGMFAGCESLTTAPELPATTLTDSCYWQMFKGCWRLTTAPELPATTLTEYCYYEMFESCISLTTAPELPATTLARYCYQRMFANSYNLTTAPVLPAPTLVQQCYYSMFENCSRLNYIKCLATSTGATTTQRWVDDVAATGTFVKHPSMTGWTTGINGIPSGWTVVNDEVTAVTFTAKANSSSVGLTKISTGQTLEYSTDGNTWSNMTTATTISLSSGQSVYIRGILSSNNTDSNNTQFTMSGNIKASGNINYLWDKDNPDAALKGYCGAALFSGCTALTDVVELELPATTLSERCYRNMFRNTRITTAPALPATTLATYCYSSMFNNCTSLTSAPSLPAITLATYCYYYMFENCSALTTAPELPATTLVNYCYNNMFKNCSSLNYIKCLATNISASNCTVNWVSGVASTGTFVSDPNMYNWTIGVNGIPTDWVATNSFRLTAKSNNSTVGLKKKSSYHTVQYTTNGTSWLTMTTATTVNLSSGETIYIRGTLSSNNSLSNYTNFKFSGNVAISGNINYLWNYSNPTASLKNYCGYFLFSDCTAITDASELRFPATTLAQSCYMTMFQNCSGLTSGPSILPATSLVDSCYRGMFQYTPITTAPELPATTLSTYCYQNMFRGCTHLSNIKCLATNISATNSTTNWVQNVAATGTFVKHPSMTGWTTGNNGIPSGWTTINN